MSPHVLAAILIIPGRKGFGNPLYEDLKKLLLQDIPVPSQMILAQTIDRARNALYTVTNKILIQMVAKIGGEPWAINELPFFHLCSMTAGYYVSNS